MLNKTCGSLKAFNSGLEFETIVSAAVDQGNTDFYHGFVGSVFFLFFSLFMETSHISGDKLPRCKTCDLTE